MLDKIDFRGPFGGSSVQGNMQNLSRIQGNMTTIKKKQGSFGSLPGIVSMYRLAGIFVSLSSNSIVHNHNSAKLLRLKQNCT